MISFTINEIERNKAGKRIVKITETGKTPGGMIATTVSYVVHAPSRLVPARVNGKFSSLKTFAPVAPDMLDKATGWTFESRFATHAEARLALGINTSPKREDTMNALVATLARQAENAARHRSGGKLAA